MSKAARHTPGPWRFHPESLGPMPIWSDCENSAGREVRQVVATAGATYNHLDVTLYGEQNKREVADAYLIAAAPDLLAALKAVIAITDRDDAAHEQARAAIDKAEGRGETK